MRASSSFQIARWENAPTGNMFGKLHIAPIVHEFLSAYPEVNVRLILTDAVIDLVELRIDAAVRIGQLPDSRLVARRVGEVGLVGCTSPEYLARCGAPTRPAATATKQSLPLPGLELSLRSSGKSSERTAAGFLYSRCRSGSMLPCKTRMI
jgi:DNA-binding transcriptional LysR family regulator